MARILSRLMFAGLMFAPLPIAAQDISGPQISSEMRGEIIESLGKALRENYVFSEIADSTASELSQRATSGADDNALTAKSFAEALHSEPSNNRQ